MKNNIAIIFSVSFCTYTGTPVSWPVAVVTDRNKIDSVKEKIIAKYGDCEISYVSLNEYKELTEEDIKEVN